MVAYDAIEDAEDAREMVRLGLEWLFAADGYTVAQLRVDLVEPVLAELERD